MRPNVVGWEKSCGGGKRREFEENEKRVGTAAWGLRTFAPSPWWGKVSSCAREACEGRVYTS